MLIYMVINLMLNIGNRIKCFRIMLIYMVINLQRTTMYKISVLELC